MASIKGFSMKKIVQFRGHEGEPCFQGDIHYNGKKVGEYTDDTWGGGANIDFANKEFEEIANKASAEFFAKRPELLENLPPDLEFFFQELLNLIAYEKDYKKVLRKGYARMIVYTKEKKTWRATQAAFRTAELGCKWREQNPIANIIVDFKSLDDFIIN